MLTSKLHTSERMSLKGLVCSWSAVSRTYLDPKPAVLLTVRPFAINLQEAGT